MDVGQPKDFLSGTCLYLTSVAKKNPETLVATTEPFVHGGNVLIDPTANISPEAKIGPNVVIGPNVTVGTRTSRLRHSPCRPTDLYPLVSRRVSHRRALIMPPLPRRLMNF